MEKVLLKTPKRKCRKIVSCKKLCCCCQNNPSSTSFWSHKGDSETYGQMLINCFCIELASNNEDVICVDCVDQLQAAVKFKQQVLCAQNLQQNANVWENYSRNEQNIPINTLEVDTPDIGFSETNDKFREVEIKIEPGTPTASVSDLTEPVVKFEVVDITEQPKTTDLTTEGSEVSAKQYKSEPCEDKFMYVDKDLQSDSDYEDKAIEHFEPIKLKATVEPVKVKPKRKYRRRNPATQKQDSTNEAAGGSKEEKPKREYHRIKYTPKRLHQQLLPEEYTEVNDSYTCNTCHKSFQHLSKIALHVLKKHRRIPTEKCHLCDELFYSGVQLNMHLTEAHNMDLRCICNECGKVFYKMPYLKRHLNEVHKFGKEAKCPYCDFVTYNERSLKMHIIKHNIDKKKQPGRKIIKGGNFGPRKQKRRLKKAPKLSEHIESKSRLSRFTCKHCDTTFVSRLDIVRHIKIKHRHIPTEICDLCSEKFVSEIEHIESKSRLSRFTCKHCDTTFVSRLDIVRHIKIKHRHIPTEICDICSEKFVSEIEHIESKSRLSRFTCKHCDTTFVSRLDIVRHIKIKHRHIPTEICDLCNEKFVSEIGLNKHKTEVHNIDYRRICNECDEVFYSATTLVCHLKEAHEIGESAPAHQSSKGESELKTEDDKIKPPKRKKKSQRHPKLSPEEYTKISETCYACNECNESYRQVASLFRHVFIKHRGVLPETCDICNEKFLSYIRLYQHKFEVHNIDLRQICNACNQVFYTPRSLACHMNKYHKMGEEKKCPHCDYTTHYDINRHIETHNTEYIFQCQYCPKKFRRQISLLRHVRTHTGDKRHVCKICGERFVWSSGLRWHISKHHPENIAEARGSKSNISVPASHTASE